MYSSTFLWDHIVKHEKDIITVYPALVPLKEITKLSDKFVLSAWRKTTHRNIPGTTCV